MILISHTLFQKRELPDTWLGLGQEDRAFMTGIRASVGDLRSLGLVVWGCNSNTREAQPGRSEVHSKTQSQNYEMFLPL